MVDLIYGRGITDLLREMPFYISIFKKMTAYRLFKTKQPMYGSVDVNNVCNLHCTHCYWWLNRKEEEQDMSVEDWRRIIREKFNKQHIFVTTLVGGEPTLRPEIIQVFCEEMPKRVCVVTNATFPLKRYDGLYFYWVSMMEHNTYMIRLEEKERMERRRGTSSIILQGRTVTASLLGKRFGYQ
jgi:Fe-coproporphyrin III synthase